MMFTLFLSDFDGILFNQGLMSINLKKEKDSNILWGLFLLCCVLACYRSKNQRRPSWDKANPMHRYAN